MPWIRRTLEVFRTVNSRSLKAETPVRSQGRWYEICGGEISTATGGFFLISSVSRCEHLSFSIYVNIPLTTIDAIWYCKLTAFQMKQK